MFVFNNACTETHTQTQHLFESSVILNSTARFLLCGDKPGSLWVRTFSAVLGPSYKASWLVCCLPASALKQGPPSWLPSRTTQRWGPILDQSLYHQVQLKAKTADIHIGQPFCVYLWEFFQKSQAL